MERRLETPWEKIEERVIFGRENLNEETEMWHLSDKNLTKQILILSWLYESEP